MTEAILPGDFALQLLQEISEWGDVTTIILHGGSVFEFKGPFPSGHCAQGYYNLKGKGEGSSAGFEGHLNLKLVDGIHFQEKQHRGRNSYALVFMDRESQPIFKIFLGRNSNGDIYQEQLDAYLAMQSTYKTNQ